ncbi:MAG: hypothetical protein ED557_13635 [Balneola sp.]|nr:MAG: hypothetical protein ED557_13635 [Balneola sp.]
MFMDVRASYADWWQCTNSSGSVIIDIVNNDNDTVSWIMYTSDGIFLEEGTIGGQYDGGDDWCYPS